MPESASAYPLAWPEGWPRSRTPKSARFDATFDVARKNLEFEIQRMGGRYLVISCNIPLRRDGRPYASKPATSDDTGVAVYFERDGKQMVFACDRWNTVKDNIRAIAKTIEAIRGIERWGASEMMERALTAFLALPPPLQWWDILGVPRSATVDEISAAHRKLAALHHPDRPNGSAARMAEVNAARDDAIKEREAA